MAAAERPPDARTAFCAAVHAADCEAAPQHPGGLPRPHRGAEPAAADIPGGLIACDITQSGCLCAHVTMQGVLHDRMSSMFSVQRCASWQAQLSSSPNDHSQTLALGMVAWALC